MSTTHKIAFAACVFALAACQPAADPAKPAAGAAPPAATQTADAAATGCNVSAQKMWIEQETPIRRYSVEAHTMGPTCEQAVAVLIIRAREGSPIYTWSGKTPDILGLYDVTDPAKMKPALEEWISGQGGHKNTSELGAWEETDGQPKRAEFPFMPESWIDKAGWDKMKADKLDMFCFVQGHESMKCAVLRDGEMEDVGLQLFPG